MFERRAVALFLIVSLYSVPIFAQTLAAEGDLLARIRIS